MEWSSTFSLNRTSSSTAFLFLTFRKQWLSWPRSCSCILFVCFQCTTPKSFPYRDYALPWPVNLPFSRKLPFHVLLVLLSITGSLRVSLFSFFSPTTFGTPEIYSHILPRNHFTFSKLPEERALIKTQLSCNVVEHMVDHAESYYFNKNSSFRL